MSNFTPSYYDLPCSARCYGKGGAIVYTLCDFDFVLRMKKLGLLVEAWENKTGKVIYKY